MKFVLIPIIIWILSQTTKLIVRLVKGKKFNLKTIVWVYQYAGGAPSTHSAMLASAVYLIGKYEGFGAIFGFCVLISFIFIYNLLEDREKQELQEGYLKDSRAKFAKKIIHDGKLLDMSGHTYFEIASGLIFGLVVVYILEKILF